MLLPLGSEGARGFESCPTSEIPKNISMMFFYDLFIYFVVAAFSLFGTSN